MKRKNSVIVSVLGVLLAMGTESVFAQSAKQAAATSLNQLSGLLKSGDRVSLTDTGGRRVTGTITDLSSSGLGLRVAGAQQNYKESEIDSIQQRQFDSLTNGAAWGLGVGLGAALVMAATVSNQKYYDGELPAGPFILLGTGVGTGVGVLVDALRQEKRTVYNRSSTKRVSVSPLLGRKDLGVRLALKF